MCDEERTMKISRRGHANGNVSYSRPFHGRTRGRHPKIITLHWSNSFSFGNGIALHAALSRVLTRRPWTNLSCPGQTLSSYRYLVALNGRKPVGGEGRQPLSWQIYGIRPEKRPRVDGWNRPETPAIVHNRYLSVPFIVTVKYACMYVNVLQHKWRRDFQASVCCCRSDVLFSFL